MARIVAFALLCALSMDVGTEGSPVTDPILTAACLMMLHIIVVTFAFNLSQKIAKAIDSDWEHRADLLHQFVRGQRIHFGLWIAVNLCALYMLNWPQLIRVNCNLGPLFLVDDLIILVPIFVSWFVSNALFYDVHRAVNVLPAECAATVTRWSFTWSQARIYLGIGFVPLMLVSTSHECLQRVNPSWQHHQYAWLLFAAPLMAVLMLFPWVLRWVWPTTRLSAGPLRDRLEQLAKKSNVRVSDILVWNTNGRILNAAVAGVLPWLRYVFLSDRLLEKLSDEEIEATFAHEIGHVNYRHLTMRILAMLLPLSMWAFAQQLTPLAGAGSLQDLTNSQFLLSPLVLVGLSLAYVIFVFGWYTRQLEHQADLFACQHLAGKRDLGYAQQQYAGLISKLTPLRERTQPGFLHPNYARRLAFISGVVSDPTRSHKFEQRVRVASALVVGAAAAPLLLMWLTGQ